MVKPEVIAQFIEGLKLEFDRVVHAQRDSADYATNEESRAREKYETQSTEASYLARGQAALAEELAKSITYLEKHMENFCRPHSVAGIGSLVELELSGSREWFLISAQAGGHTIQYKNREITLITPESPVGGRILSRQPPFSFSLANGAKGRLLQVL